MPSYSPVITLLSFKSRAEPYPASLAMKISFLYGITLIHMSNEFK